MSKIFLAAAAFILATATNTFASPVVTFANGSTSEAESAFAKWQSGVTAFSVDQLGGASGSPFAVTTSAGNKFTTVDDQMSVAMSNSGVLQGTVLVTARAGKSADIIWTLATPSNAFGFFGYDLDNGTLKVTFSDGSLSVYSDPTMGNDLSSFWGISGLGKNISSISISTTDSGGISSFDRFVSGVSVANNTVPEPGSMALIGIGLAGLLAARKRKQA